MQDRVFKLIFEGDDITWKNLLFDLVKSENMNPWNVNVSELTKKYVDTLKELKKFDVRLSGKVVLAAALLVRMKSNRLMDEDLSDFDSLISQSEDMLEDEFYSELEGEFYGGARRLTDAEKIALIPRTPQPRKRKVSIYDLVNALEKALEVKKRRVLRTIPDVKNVRLPERKFDIGLVMRQVYGNIINYFKADKKAKLTFHKLLPETPSKTDKVYTFIPLLSLYNLRKLNLNQDDHFGDIHIELLGKAKKQVDEELGLI